MDSKPADPVTSSTEPSAPPTAPASGMGMTVRKLLFAWMAIWAFLAAAQLLNVPDNRTKAAGILASVLILGGFGLIRPRIGGWLLMAAGIAGTMYFQHPPSQMGLAMPAVVIGVGLVIWPTSKP